MVEQIDRDAAAKALGYGTWEDATDYRNSGAEDRRAKHMVEAFAAHRAAERARMIALLREPDAAMVEAVATAITDRLGELSGVALKKSTADHIATAALAAAADAMEAGDAN